MPGHGPTAGVRTPPISQFVLKVHSRCDLACDHCYVYEHRDQSWRTRPLGIAPEVARQAAVRIAEHAAEHELPAVRIVLHGGEPLLLGPRRMGEVIGVLHEHIGGITELDIRVHTNGVLLSPEFCDVFARDGVRVGVSLDGDRAANDRHRNYADGRSSHGAVLRALQLLRRPEYRRLYAGILCTIDLANDPIEVYEALLAEDPPRIDFLLPHATWDHPPPRQPGRPTEYADWLSAIFDRWSADGRPVPVRFFESIEAVADGAPSGTEAIGLDPVDLLVVETGGEWEQVDSLKTAYDGAPMLIGPTPANGTVVLNVFEHSADDAAAHPAVAARQLGAAELSETCLACPLVKRCGGGLYSHRYRSGSGFRNPSVYCEDLKSLIMHIGEPDPVQYAHFGLAEVRAAADGPVGRDWARRMVLTHAEIVRALFADIADRVEARSSAAERLAAESWQRLCALDREAPRAVRTVLDHPFARTWAVRCIRRLDKGGPFSAEDGDRMAAFAHAAARRAGVDAPGERPAHLPTVGTPGHPAAWIEDWGNGVLLEDLDPYRDTYPAPVAEPLAEPEVRKWREMTATALDVLAEWSPQYAEQVRYSIRTLVPLAADPGGGERSATHRDAPGAIAVALPNGPEALAMLLVHESQHVLLYTVFDTHDLFEWRDERTFPVGWREDPRPISGVLHGAFAWLALAEIWQIRELSRTGDSDRARDLARTYAGWSRDALDQLKSADALLPLGVSFTGRLDLRIRRILES